MDLRWPITSYARGLRDNWVSPQIPYGSEESCSFRSLCETAVHLLRQKGLPYDLRRWIMRKYVRPALFETETHLLISEKVQNQHLFDYGFQYEIIKSCLSHVTRHLRLKTGYVVAGSVPFDSCHMVPLFSGWSCSHFRQWMRVRAPASMQQYRNWALFREDQTDEETINSPPSKRAHPG